MLLGWIRSKNVNLIYMHLSSLHFCTQIEFQFFPHYSCVSFCITHMKLSHNLVLLLPTPEATGISVILFTPKKTKEAYHSLYSSSLQRRWSGVKKERSQNKIHCTDGGAESCLLTLFPWRSFKVQYWQCSVFKRLTRAGDDAKIFGLVRKKK